MKYVKNHINEKKGPANLIFDTTDLHYGIKLMRDLRLTPYSFKRELSMHFINLH